MKVVKKEEHRGTQTVFLGHKCMIYLQPLDEDHGLFELDEKKLNMISGLRNNI